MNRHERRAAAAKATGTDYVRRIKRMVTVLRRLVAAGPLRFRLPDRRTALMGVLSDPLLVDRICIDDDARGALALLVQDAHHRGFSAPTIIMLDAALHEVGIAVERVDALELTAGLPVATWERDVRAWQLPPAQCPSCGTTCEGGRSSQGGSDLPSPGDLALCFECGALNQYGEGLRTLRAFDESQLDPDDAAHIAKLRAEMARHRPGDQGRA